MFLQGPKWFWCMLKFEDHCQVVLWKTPDFYQTTYLLLGAWRFSKTSHFHQSPFLCVYCAVVYSTLSYPPIPPSFISYPQKWINTSTSLHSFSRTQYGHCWVPPVCVHMCFFSDTSVRFQGKEGRGVWSVLCYFEPEQFSFLKLLYKKSHTFKTLLLQLKNYGGFSSK